MAVQGNLKYMSLPNMVQTICLDQRQVALVVRRQIEEGVLFFEGGEVVHAQVGSLEGEEAVYYLLKWTDGTFQMHDNVSVPRRTVNAAWNHLLMEGMRLLDEQGVSDAEPRRELTPEEQDHDTELEYQLILLLSNLEQMQVHLSERKVRRRPATALEILTKIVNELVAFSENWLEERLVTDSLSKALAKSSDIYPAAKLLQVRQNRLLDRVMLNLYNSWTGNPAGRQEMFHQIVQSMLDILETYFSLLNKRFYSAETAEQCQEVCNIFLADLTQIVDEIRF